MRMRRCEEPVTLTLPTWSTRDGTVTAIAHDCDRENWASSSAITRAGVSREAEDNVHMSAGG